MNTKLNSELGEFEKDAKVGVLSEEKREELRTFTDIIILTRFNTPINTTSNHHTPHVPISPTRNPSPSKA